MHIAHETAVAARIRSSSFAESSDHAVGASRREIASLRRAISLIAWLPVSRRAND